MPLISKYSPIFATEAGTAYHMFNNVPDPKNPKSYGGGNMILIVHDNGLKSIYAHLNYPTKDTGGYPKWVEKDEQIGLSGDQVNVGAHLHFTVVEYDGNPYSLNGTPVPIWQMPGITWDPKYDDLPYPASGVCLSDGLSDGEAQWPPPGKRSLERSEFTVERTNPALSEEVLFSTEIKNTGEVPVYVNTVFLRLTRGTREVNVYGLVPEQGTVSIPPGEVHLFDLRAPPLPEAGMWRIQKVEVRDVVGTWFNLGEIRSHLMVGYQNLIKDHPATASSVRVGSGNGPQKANDGNMRTRWESEWSDDQWLEFDLDSEKTIDTIIVRSGYANTKRYNGFNVNLNGDANRYSGFNANAEV